LFPLLQGYLQGQSGSNNNNANIQNLIEFLDTTQPTNNGEWLFDEAGLRRYVLVACQEPDGGLKDKPGK
jgi:prenyltransferase beta subunit